MPDEDPTDLTELALAQGGSLAGMDDPFPLVRGAYRSRRGGPLASHEVVVDLIPATTRSGIRALDNELSSGMITCYMQ